MDVYMKMSNFVGTFLQMHEMPYSFEIRMFESRYTTEYNCYACSITVNFWGGEFVWGRVDQGQIYKLLDKLEDFKSEIRAKCVFK